MMSGKNIKAVWVLGAVVMIAVFAFNVAAEAKPPKPDGNPVGTWHDPKRAGTFHGIETIEEEKTSIPKVLIIGDPISLGYTPLVAEMLEGSTKLTQQVASSIRTAIKPRTRFQWKSEVPKDCPFEQSETLTGIFFTRDDDCRRKYD